METATHGTDGSTPPQPGVGTHAQPPSDDAPPAAVGGDVTGDIGMVVRYPEEMFNEAMDKSLLGLPASAHGIVERVRRLASKPSEGASSSLLLRK